MACIGCRANATHSTNAICNPPKEDKLVDRVARCNPKTYGGSYDPVELEEWIRGMEKIFVTIEVPDEKSITIETFYLTMEADIW